MTDSKSNMQEKVAWAARSLDRMRLAKTANNTVDVQDHFCQTAKRKAFAEGSNRRQCVRFIIPVWAIFSGGIAFDIGACPSKRWS